MKVGIISFAHMHAHSYAQAIQELEGVELAGIYDDDPERGQKAAARYQTTFYSSYQELLASEIDAVIVTSENASHREHVVACAAAGKHVLCEKPLATTAEDAEAMIQACREHQVILQTAFPVRYNTAILRAKAYMEEGKLGRIIAMKGTNRGKNPGGWFVDPQKSGGGAVIDHTVHVVDIMRWFLGAEVAEVYAEVGYQLASEIPIDDCGLITMEFNNGVFATLDCSWSRNQSYPTWGDVTLEIVGTDGTLKIDAFAQKLDVYSNDSGHIYAYWGDDMDQQLVHDFLDSVRKNEQPKITGEDGLRALEVALAAYQSARELEPVRIEKSQA
ncbi:Gfo/Idh/MocA family protein [Brevibacillus migulae]|uniref:Gfo/Idh/MocA family protein n=1 Tax=Brevibacillus migulae TaxID=1644114 RepID=UPI00106EDFD4|nr:Gfo/Idh/MocA family oxidoreductase [Brevibacillus migulae]